MTITRHNSSWLIASFSIVVLLFFLLGMYRDTSQHVIDAWGYWDRGYSHGYLALVISLYLVFHERKILVTLTPCTNIMALFAVAASSLIWVLAMLAGVQLVQIAMLLLLAISTIWVVLGSRLVRHLLVPFIIIALAFPIWSPLQPFFQKLTAAAVYWLTRVFEVPALRQEYVITLPAGELSITESCSGVSYLLAALVLGVLYGYLHYRGFWSRAIVVLLAAVAAVMANVLRVFIVVYLAFKTDMQHPMVADHLNLGWYLFGGLVLVLLVIDAGLSRVSRRVSLDHRYDDRAMSTVPCQQGYLLRMLIPVFAMFLLAAGPVTARWILYQVAPAQDVRIVFPQGRDGWSGPSETEDDWRPVYHGAIEKLHLYNKGEDKVYLYIGYYPDQKQGSEVISDLNRVTDEKTWRSSYPRDRVLNIPGGNVLEQRLTSRAGRQRLVWYWYRVAGQDTTNRYNAKVLQLLGLVASRPEAAVFALATDAGSDDELARQLMGEFLLTTGQSLSGDITEDYE